MIEVKGQWEFVKTLDDIYKVLLDNIGQEFTDAAANIINSKVEQELDKQGRVCEKEGCQWRII